jgi:microcin C transport system substrate-binding protein
VPHWHTSYDRLVYWNKFSRPKINATQAPVMTNILDWWWWDESKAKKLAGAQATGASIK